jgi:ethanolamine ammonia-lyase small subunit
MTHGPRVGRTDAERNCISNVRPEGLGHGEAAFRLHWLLEQAFLRGLSGVSLKDESDRPWTLPRRRGWPIEGSPV